ncbi:MAG: hypothetical protein WDN46_03500 [Methylocella sp.]
MRRLISITAAVAFMAAEAATGGAMAAAAAPVASLEGLAHNELPLEQAQFAFGGRNYCWYGNGWQGPGWYWCGFAFRRGLGWGGPQGWRGWNNRPGWNNGRRPGGAGWHGGRGGVHGGVHRGGGHDGRR